MKHTLEGKVKDKTILLDGQKLNHSQIKNDYGYKVHPWGWGQDNADTSKLAIAIMLQLTGKPNGYKQLKFELLIFLNSKEDFQIEFELMSNARKKTMIMAMAHNKYLTVPYLIGRSDAELCCFIHPLYREDYEILLGLRTERVIR
jgi:hypothetical protein